MKKIISTLLAIAFALSTASAVFAASGKCTVVEVDNNKVTLDCGSNAKDFPVGTDVKIKTAKKKAIEGC